MSANEYLIDTNILIYHTKGSQHTVDFITGLINKHAFNISIMTKIEFLGWDKHTPDGYERCKRLLEGAVVLLCHALLKIRLDFLSKPDRL